MPSIIGCRIDWTNYFVYAIESVANGQEFDQDYCYGYDHGDVVLTELNERSPPPAPLRSSPRSRPVWLTAPSRSSTPPPSPWRARP